MMYPWNKNQPFFVLCTGPGVFCYFPVLEIFSILDPSILWTFEGFVLRFRNLLLRQMLLLWLMCNPMFWTMDNLDLDNNLQNHGNEQNNHCLKYCFFYMKASLMTNDKLKLRQEEDSRLWYNWLITSWSWR